MPEIAEVRVVADVLKKKLIGKRIEAVKILYPGIIEGDKNEFAKTVLKKTIMDISTNGKWILFNLGEYTMLSHLRMEGKYFYLDRNKRYMSHDHIVFELSDGFDLRYNDTRKFGKMSIVKTDEVPNAKAIKKLGFEPDDKRLTAEYLLEKLKGKRKPIKSVLLDQTIINGLGNIYVNEVLFLSGINPLRPANLVTALEAEKIVKNSREIILLSYSMGGCTIRSYTSSLGVKGRFQEKLTVHMRDNLPCQRCKNKILKIEVDGRGTYYCPSCQKN